MPSSYRILSALALWSFLRPSWAADQPAYQPCPIFRAYYPPPTIDKSSDVMQSFSKNFTATFDELVRTGKHEIYGDITPNTTSFSVVLFSTADDSIFFEYHHTAPAAKAKVNVTMDTVFPVGSLTQLFAVYAWLAKFGDKEWDTPITKFLPELLRPPTTPGKITVPWSEVTIGALASHMAGIVRDSNACQLGKPCDRQQFLETFAQVPPLFLPDTTPIYSNAGFQLLAFALAKSAGGKKGEYGDVLRNTILKPLGMAQSGLLGEKGVGGGSIFGEGLDASAPGEQGALSLLSTTRDLARAGHAMLTSRLLPAAMTRRWFSTVADTSNLRNAVGRPWEVYHASAGAGGATAPVVDIYLKSGAVGAYSSYMGVSPDLGVGFAILAHDANAGTANNNTSKPATAADLNVYADVVADTLGDIFTLAAKDAAARFGKVFKGRNNNGNDKAEFKIARDGPGLVVSDLVVAGVDIRAEVAAAAGIALENLDFRVYPSIEVKKGPAAGEAVGLYQFVAVYQDMSAPVDAGTPTCITWMTVGEFGSSAVDRVVFELDSMGVASGVRIPGRGVTLSAVE